LTLRDLAHSVIHVLPRTLGHPTGLVGMPLATIMALRLKKASLRCRTIKDLVDLTYSLRLGRLNIRPAQVKEEIFALLQLIARARPETILEIGTATGGTLFLFCRAARSNATLISIDLPSGPFGGAYPEWKIPLYRSFALERQKIILVRADSHNPIVLERVKKILSDGKLSFLFVDGDHTYKGVKRDFVMYAKLVKPGGIVAFHDIVPGPANSVGEVPLFWSKIRGEFRHKELIKNRQQGGYGIGVLYV
jgi:predicted O-methyltransferase YrrM